MNKLWIPFAVLIPLLWACQLPWLTAEGATQTLALTSAAGYRYSLQVWVPDGTSASDSLSTLYVLDGDEVFGSTVGLVRDLISKRLVPPMVVVGVGYGQGANERTRDYTPTFWNGEGGGVQDFLEFLGGDAVPAVEAQFPVWKDRTGRVLAGHSFGGLAVLEAQFTRPELFGSFAASSPSLWWDGNGIFDHLEVFLNGAAPPPSQVFLSVGSHEGDGMEPLLLEFARRWKAQLPPSVAVTDEVFAGKQHWNVRGEALTAALTEFFRSAP